MPRWWIASLNWFAKSIRGKITTNGVRYQEAWRASAVAVSTEHEAPAVSGFLWFNPRDFLEFRIEDFDASFLDQARKIIRHGPLQLLLLEEFLQVGRDLFEFSLLRRDFFQKFDHMQSDGSVNHVADLAGRQREGCRFE